MSLREQMQKDFPELGNSNVQNNPNSLRSHMEQTSPELAIPKIENVTIENTSEPLSPMAQLSGEVSERVQADANGVLQRLGNQIRDDYNTAKNVVTNIPEMGKGFVQSIANGIGYTAHHPLKGLWAGVRGMGEGTMALPQDIYNGFIAAPINRVANIATGKKPLPSWDYMSSVKRNNDRAYGNVDEDAQALYDLGGFMAVGGAAGKAAGMIGKTKKAADMIGKASKASKRIEELKNAGNFTRASKLADKTRGLRVNSSLTRNAEEMAHDFVSGYMYDNNGDYQHGLENGLAGVALGRTFKAAGKGKEAIEKSPVGKASKENFESFMKNHPNVSKAMADINSMLGQDASGIVGKYQDFIKNARKDGKELTQEQADFFKEFEKLPEEEQMQVFDILKRGESVIDKENKLQQLSDNNKARYENKTQESEQYKQIEEPNKKQEENKSEVIKEWNEKDYDKWDKEEQDWYDTVEKPYKQNKELESNVSLLNELNGKKAKETKPTKSIEELQQDVKKATEKNTPKNTKSKASEPNSIDWETYKKRKESKENYKTYKQSKQEKEFERLKQEQEITSSEQYEDLSNNSLKEQPYKKVDKLPSDEITYNEQPKPKTFKQKAKEKIEQSMPEDSASPVTSDANINTPKEAKTSQNESHSEPKSIEDILKDYKEEREVIINAIEAGKGKTVYKKKTYKSKKNTNGLKEGEEYAQISNKYDKPFKSEEAIKEQKQNINKENITILPSGKAEGSDTYYGEIKADKTANRTSMPEKSSIARFQEGDRTIEYKDGKKWFSYKKKVKEAPKDNSAVPEEMVENAYGSSTEAAEKANAESTLEERAKIEKAETKAKDLYDEIQSLKKKGNQNSFDRAKIMYEKNKSKFTEEARKELEKGLPEKVTKLDDNYNEIKKENVKELQSKYVEEPTQKPTYKKDKYEDLDFPSSEKPYKKGEKDHFGNIMESKGDVTPSNISKDSDFAKLDRFFTSHDVSKLSHEIAPEDINVKNAIDEYLSDVKFDFDNLGEHTNGIATNNGFTINSELSLGKQLSAAKHETHHVLYKNIAEACGKDSVEYKMYMEGVDANNAIHDFEAEAPKAQSNWKKYQELSKNNEAKAKDFYNSLDFVDKLDVIEYDRLFRDYWNCDMEVSARNASKGEWKFFGKDIKDYDGILRDTRGRNNKISRGSNAKIRKNDNGGKEGVSGQSREWTHDNGRDNNVQRPNNNDRKGFVESKDVDFDPKDINKETKTLTANARSNAEVTKQFSNAGESAAIRIGLLNTKQAVNRLKLQDSEGKGTYHKRVSETKERDLYQRTRDYLNEMFGNKDAKKVELNEDKIGLTGRKTLRGLKNKLDTKQSMIATLQDASNKIHTANVIDTVKNEFSLDYNGRNLQEGYIPVNSRVLANAYHGKLSKEWVEAWQSKNIDRQMKASNGKEDFDSWSSLLGDTAPDMQIPKSLYNELLTGEGENPKLWYDRYAGDLFSKNGVKGAGKIALAIQDAMISQWKKGVLSSASFFFNNRRGNQQMIAANADTPLEYIKATFDALTDTKTKVPDELIGNNISRAFDMYSKKKVYTGIRDVDNVLNLLNGHNIDVKALKTEGTEISGLRNYKKTYKHNAKSVTAAAANLCIGLPNRAFTHLSESLMKLNENFENLERKQAYFLHMDKAKKEALRQTALKIKTQEEFLKHIDKHPELQEQLIKNVEDTLGDYNNFNKGEQKLLKRLVPFYSWFRTVGRWNYKMAKKDPTRLSLMYLNLYKAQQQDQDLKEYQRGGIRFSVDGGKTKITTKAFTKPDVLESMFEMAEPVNNPIKKIKGEKVETGNDPSRLQFSNPILKAGDEAFWGSKNFVNPEITSKRYSRQSYYDNSSYGEMPYAKDENGKRSRTLKRFSKNSLSKGYKMANTYVGIGLQPENEEKAKHYSSAKYGYWDNKKHDWVRNSKGEIVDVAPLSVRAGYLTKEIAKSTVAPYMSSRVLTGTANILNGNDKSYDADIGGYKSGDVIDEIPKSKRKEFKDKAKKEKARAKKYKAKHKKKS